MVCDWTTVSSRKKRKHLDVSRKGPLSWLMYCRYIYMEWQIAKVHGSIYLDSCFFGWFHSSDWLISITRLLYFTIKQLYKFSVLHYYLLTKGLRSKRWQKGFWPFSGIQTQTTAAACVQFDAAQTEKNSKTMH